MKAARKSQRWTDEEIRFLREHDHEMTRAEMARRLRRKVNAVSRKALEIGLDKRKDWTKEERSLKKPFEPIEMTEDQLDLERESFDAILSAWRAGHKDVGRVMDYFHTERRIIHGWQAETKRFGTG